MKAATAKQKVILDFIRSRRIPPTIREIASHIGVRSPQVVQGQLEALMRKGLVKWDFGKHRSLEVVE